RLLLRAIGTDFRQFPGLARTDHQKIVPHPMQIERARLGVHHRGRCGVDDIGLAGQIGDDHPIAPRIMGMFGGMQRLMQIAQDMAEEGQRLKALCFGQALVGQNAFKTGDLERGALAIAAIGLHIESGRGDVAIVVMPGECMAPAPAFTAQAIGPCGRIAQRMDRALCRPQPLLRLQQRLDGRFRLGGNIGQRDIGDRAVAQIAPCQSGGGGGKAKRGNACGQKFQTLAKHGLRIGQNGGADFGNAKARFAAGDHHFGIGRRMLARLGHHAGVNGGQFAGLHLVRLGQHEAIGQGRTVEHFHHLKIGRLHPMAAVDQHQRPLEHHPPAQEIAHQLLPLLHHLGRGLGKAIAGHVDQTEIGDFPRHAAHVEEVQLLRAPRRDRGTRQRLAPGDGVKQRGLAHIRPPGKGDLRHHRIGQELQRGRRKQKVHAPGKDLPGALDQFKIVVFVHFFLCAAASTMARSLSTFFFRSGCRAYRYFC
ncbi:hypothetical protein E4T56_gene5777, partial [Termitomyces sp. T112]